MKKLVILSLAVICALMLFISCQSDDGSSKSLSVSDDDDNDDDDQSPVDDDDNDTTDDDNDASDDDDTFPDDDDTGDDDDDDNDTVDPNIWTDPDTGLTWQVGYAPDLLPWADAVTYCETLELSGYDDWRLPTISELRTLIVGCEATEAGGSCAITDECFVWDTCWSTDCRGCAMMEGPNQGFYIRGEVKMPEYINASDPSFWSSVESPDYIDYSFEVNYANASVGASYQIGEHPKRVRCVR